MHHVLQRYYILSSDVSLDVAEQQAPLGRLYQSLEHRKMRQGSPI